jgi:diguanylate cyclase (GGDEF)-like protein
MRMLIGSVLLFTIGITVCTVVSLARMGSYNHTLEPGFIPDSDEMIQIIRIASISPWAFIGFENISHSTEEFTFGRKKSFRILSIAVISSTILYILITLLSVAAFPSEYGDWLSYMQDHGNLTGLEGLPPFYVAYYYMGNTGVRILMLSLLALIVSSLIGNILALSRLLCALGRDNVMPEKFTFLNDEGTPVVAIAFIAAVSMVIPLLGRTAVGWIVDVTTIGATIVYGFVSGTCLRLARRRGDTKEMNFGIAGLILMICFAAMLLVPSLFGSGDLAPETYFLFTIWAILGFLFFRGILRRDTDRRFGKSVVVWIALLGMIIFTTLVWMGEESVSSINDSVESVRSFYVSKIVEDARVDAARESGAVWAEIKEIVNEETLDLDYEDHQVAQELAHIRQANTSRVLTVFILFMLSIGVLLNNYSVVIKRADRNEEELGIAMEKANIDALTGVKSRRMMSDYERAIDAQIQEGTCGEMAVVICDVNDLKFVNDHLGHKAGDEYIKSASRMICKIYRHSPVFRIGGDEFTVILTGDDYMDRHFLLEELNRQSEANIGSGNAVVAAGMADYDIGEDESLLFLLNRADKAMYRRKEELKNIARARAGAQA